MGIKAWRLGAAVLNKLRGTDENGREYQMPAARVIKSVATSLGVELKRGERSSRYAGKTQAQRFQPSGYVAPRRRSLRVTGQGEAFVLLGNPTEVV